MRRCILLRLLAFVCVVLTAATLAHAQNDVVIDVQGVAPGVPVEIFLSGARADRTIAGASGSVASDFMSDGKAADVVIDRCQDMVFVSVIEEGRLPPPDAGDCDRTIERVQWAAGMRLVIDGARGVLVRNPTIGTRPEVQAASREFSLSLSLDYVRPSGSRTTQPSPAASSSPSVTLSGRVVTPRGPFVLDRRWYYSIGTARAIGLAEADGTGGNSAVVVDPEWDEWIEVREPERPPTNRVDDVNLGLVPNAQWGPFYFFRGPQADRAVVRLLSTVSRILPNFVERGIKLRGSAGPPQDMVFSGSRVQQTDQGQVSVATSPSSNRNGGTVSPPQLPLRALSFIDTLRRSLVPTARSAAFSAPGVRLVIGPRGRREYWIEPMQSIAAAPQSAAGIPRPSLKVFVRSLGRSTGENAQQAIIINDGNVPVRVLEGEEFATEPLEGVSEQALAKEMEKYAGRPRMTMNLTSYCLNFKKAAPTKGRVYRVAARTAQDQLEPVRRILQAAERVRDEGGLTPDGDPNLYYHSVRQWAIWTVEQRFTERTFAEALLEYTKKNVVAAGRRWTREIESAARSIIPNRWRDVQRVLAEARG